MISFYSIHLEFRLKGGLKLKLRLNSGFKIGVFSYLDTLFNISSQMIKDDFHTYIYHGSTFCTVEYQKALLCQD